MCLTVHEVICIQCPLACRIGLTVEDNGKIAEISNYQCRIGKEYAEQEYKSPKRVLTATVRTESSFRPLLPVRTDKPIPKDALRGCMFVLGEVTVKPVLAAGDFIIENILGTGANVVCTDDLLR
jgi:CxxC motif-containing protein